MKCLAFLQQKFASSSKDASGVREETVGSKVSKVSIKPKVSTPRTSHQVGSPTTVASSWKVIPRHALHQPPNGDSHATPKPAFSLHLGANLEPHRNFSEEREPERSPAARPRDSQPRPGSPPRATRAAPAGRQRPASSCTIKSRRSARRRDPRAAIARPPTAASRITPGPEGPSTRAAELRLFLGSARLSLFSFQTKPTSTLCGRPAEREGGAAAPGPAPMARSPAPGAHTLFF